MKKTLFFFAYACIMLTTCLFGEIRESSSLQELRPFVDKRTLILLDIDDTLMVPVQTLGTDAWFTARLKERMENKNHAALEETLAEWEAIRQLTKMQVVEEGTQDVIAYLQENQVPLMGLTTQGLELSSCTVRQLLGLHIDLEKTAPAQENHYFKNDLGVLYRKGILFTSGTDKGAALFKFLDLIHFKPERIVFINDKYKHLESIEKAAKARDIAFIGLRFNGSDRRVANYNPQIAQIQWEFSSPGYLLSDEEAAELLAES